MSVTVIDHGPKLIAKSQTNGSMAIRRALQDVLRESRSKTPLAETSFLRNNTRLQVLGLRGKLVWSAAYAQYQERGRRRDGSHVVKHYTTGGTGKHFAYNAIRKIDSNRGKYLRGLLK